MTEWLTLIDDLKALGRGFQKTYPSVFGRNETDIQDVHAREIYIESRLPMSRLLSHFFTPSVLMQARDVAQFERFTVLENGCDDRERRS